MAFLFRLPFQLLALLLRRLIGRDGAGDAVFVPAPAPWPPGEAPSPPASAAAPSPPPTSADEAIARRVEREAAAPRRPIATPPEPPMPGLGDNGHVDREATVVESIGPAADVGSAITVDEPWDGYDGMAATAVIQRVRGSDAATKAVVRLYEQQHKARATVLRATA
ncbi:MAG: hypothetical protein JWQ20_2796 [Conexibacter sp.]|nr:hypothetical protein [Conexibacter sp.]